MRYLLRILGLGVFLVTVSCSTTGLPRGAILVGGGSHISYNPPGDGTLILVEKTSGRIVVTQSSGDGKFEFDATAEEQIQMLKSGFGAPPTNARYVLYFVPREERW